ncbi:YlaI family protein [Calidifontibacillus oryziterrae]|uniref:YlaI family protein n=1 Tax=Calidifontibacillus oryziterrae TaxID=1191699 RepID=UPI0002FAAE06|nr:YlaI family protein [Calidifontibacillus oryziterrae]
MKVKCFICDKIDQLDDDAPLAKRLRNRPIHTYMCEECSNRISSRTDARKATGKFKLYNHKDYEEEW